MSEFLSTDLSASIVSAASTQKTLLCFVTDDTDSTKEWEAIVSDQEFRSRLTIETVSVRIKQGSQEAQYLNNVCPLTSIPAIVVINNGRIQHNLQSAQVSTSSLRGQLEQFYGQEASNEAHHHIPVESDQAVPSGGTPATAAQTRPKTDVYIVLPSSTGRMRLPNNAYDALVAQTQRLVDQSVSGENILRIQLRLLKNVSTIKNEVEAISSREVGQSPSLSDEAQQRLLNTPASALQARPSTESQSTTVTSSARNEDAEDSSQTKQNDTSNGTVQSSASEARSASQQHQRNQYLQQQRERENAQKAERERIKSQIKADREERRRLEGLRKQSEIDELRKTNSTTAKPTSTDIRLQVRAFDGARMTGSFPHTATIAQDIRPWVDGTAKQATPYNLKHILTPLPNRNIEASEEEQSLSDLGIIGSATLVMVPVKGYVESYTGSSSGLFSILTGAAGSVVGGIGSLLGLGGSPAPQTQQGSDNHTAEAATGTQGTTRMRTLADQRAEEARKRGNELYNGNQLNFQGRKDDESKNE